MKNKWLRFGLLLLTDILLIVIFWNLALWINAINAESSELLSSDSIAGAIYQKYLDFDMNLFEMTLYSYGWQHLDLIVMPIVGVLFAVSVFFICGQTAKSRLVIHLNLLVLSLVTVTWMILTFTRGFSSGIFSPYAALYMVTTIIICLLLYWIPMLVKAIRKE
jgi:hypothetical protein